MQQKDRIVHGGRELQDITDVVGNIRDFSEEYVTAFIDYDRTANYRKKQHRLKPRGCRKQQDKEDQHNDNQHDLRHFLFNVFLDKLVGRGHTDEISVISDHLVDLGDCLMCPFGGITFFKGNIHLGMTILIVILDVILIDELRGTIDLCCQIAPDHLIDTIDLFDGILIPFCFI